VRTLKTEPYFTPQGCVDVPYAYVYDATGLTDGQNVFNIQLPTAGDSSFILRRIVGVPTCVDTGANGGKFNYKNASGSYALAAPIVMPNVVTVVPEKLYPPNSGIFFDLYQTKQNSTACGGHSIKNGFIAFFGVRRYQLGRGYAVRETPYKYFEKRYSFEYSLTISQGHFTTLGGSITTAPQRAIVPMDVFDFELLEIMISNAGDTTGAGALATNDFQVQLYDANLHQLSSLPLNQGYINSARASAINPPPYRGIMPVPSLVYPGGGNIVFDVTSMLCTNNIPKTYNVSFVGVWRKPC
jgi:hypothetical protein